jgi:hypothetical protein
MANLPCVPQSRRPGCRSELLQSYTGQIVLQETSDHRLPSAPSWSARCCNFACSYKAVAHVKTPRPEIIYNYAFRVKGRGGLAGWKPSRAHMTHLFDVQIWQKLRNARTMASADTQHQPAHVKGWWHLSIPIWRVEASVPAAMP